MTPRGNRIEAPLIPGDGIGPEILETVVEVYARARAARTILPSPDIDRRKRWVFRRLRRSVSRAGLPRGASLRPRAKPSGYQPPTTQRSVEPSGG